MKNEILTFLILTTSVLIRSNLCSENFHVEDGNDTSFIYSHLKNISSMITFSSLETLLNTFDEGRISRCSQQLLMVLKGLKRDDVWALKLLDASGKLTSGLLSGNLFQFGHHDECFEIEHQYHDTSDFENGTLKGQYCIASMNLPIHLNNQATQLKMRLGLCTPSACSANDLNLVSELISKLTLPATKITFTDKFCSTVDTEIEIPTRTILAIILFALYGIILILGTVLDISGVEGFALMKCFSLYTNSKKLFALKSKPGGDSINCLNGIRVISMMMVLLGHVYVFKSSMPSLNSVIVEEYKNRLFNYFFVGLGFSVDTFFTVSGLLVFYLYTKATDKGKKIPWGMFYIHRLLRLTPSVLILVYFYTSLLQFFEIKLYPMIDTTYGQVCRENWWSTVLYIQNYVNPNRMCAEQTWYLAIDTQLYFLAPPILIAMTRRPKETLYALGILMSLSIGAAFEITMRKNLGATYLHQNADEYSYLYTPTHIRAVPWLIGGLTGYIIAKNKYRNKPLNKVLVICLWVLCLSALIFVLLIQKVYHDSEYSSFTSALFNAFSRPIWATALCIIIWLCVCGYGGYINSFLSCQAFNFLIRLNFSAYLVHIIIVSIIMGGNMDSPQFLSNFNIVHEAVADYCIVLIFAVLWTVSFESPIIAMEKIIFSSGKEKESNLKDIDPNEKCEKVIVDNNTTN